MDIQSLAAALDQHDQYVRELASGRMGFAEFLDRYDNFYWAFALDGHEVEPGAAALAGLASRIEPHRRIAEEVLAVLASESSAAHHSAGRISPTQATERIKAIALGLPVGGA